jgi:hypothetical protein
MLMFRTTTDVLHLADPVFRGLLVKLVISEDMLEKDVHLVLVFRHECFVGCVLFQFQLHAGAVGTKC